MKARVPNSPPPKPNPAASSNPPSTKPSPPNSPLRELPMSAHPTHLPPPMNHVFVDFENVHEVDPAVIGARSVSLTLLLGARQTRLDAASVLLGRSGVTPYRL